MVVACITHWWASLLFLSPIVVIALGIRYAGRHASSDEPVSWAADEDLLDWTDDDATPVAESPRSVGAATV